MRSRKRLAKIAGMLAAVVAVATITWIAPLWAQEGAPAAELTLGVFGGGGGISASEGYAANSVLGQPDAAPLEGEGVSVSPGGITAFAATIGSPGPPQNLSAQPGLTLGEIRLTWSPPASNGGPAISGYRIYRGTSSEAMSFLAQIGNVTSYNDSVEMLTSYYYRVSAINPLEGIQSNQSCNRAFPWIGLLGCL